MTNILLRIFALGVSMYALYSIVKEFKHDL